MNAFDNGLMLAKRIRNRDLTCIAALESYLERAQRLNAPLNAIVEWRTDAARTEARELDAALARGEIRGPLHGVPMTVKESFDIAGMHTTLGNPTWKGNIATEDALPITRLKQAGVVIFGKTNVPLNLADFQSYNDIYGTTNNPWDVSRSSGGSSGGSAASMAAGLAGVEVGSDIGGSIRNPAHYCGVFGHKPTWGLLPPRGHGAPDTLAPWDLAAIGPLARSAADLEALTLAMAGPDEIYQAGYRLELKPSRAHKLSDLKVAVMVNCEEAPVDSATRARVELVAEAIGAAGGTVDYNARPDFDLGAAHHAYQTLLWAVMASRNPDDAYAQLQEAAGALDPHDDSEQARLLRAQTSTYRDYIAANEQRTRIRWAWHAFFKEWDLLLAPIMATAAFPHDHRRMHERRIDVDGDERLYFEQVFWAGLAINAYLPSTVIPTGGHPDAGSSGNSGRNLPIGVQLIGPEFGDLKTLGAAKLLEAAGFGFVAPPGY